MVDRLLSLKAQLDEVLAAAFASAPAYADQLASALQVGGGTVGHGREGV